MKKSRFLTRRLGVAAAAACLLAGLGSAASAAQLWYDGFALPPYQLLTEPGNGGTPTTPPVLPSVTLGGYVANLGYLGTPELPGPPIVPATPPQPAAPAVPGQNGGTGTFFTGPWQVAGASGGNAAQTALPNVAGNYHTVAPTSLTMPNLIQPSVGGSVVGKDTPGSCCDTARDARLFASSWGSDPDETVYMSFLVNYGVGPTLHHRVFEMWNGDQNNDGNRQLQLGYSDFTGVGSRVPLDTTLPQTSRKMGIQVHDSGAGGTVNQDLVGAPDFTASGGQTHLMVLRFDLSSDDAFFGGVGDRIRVYFDPRGTTEPGSAAADIGGIDFAADRMGAITDFVFGDSAKAAAFDEVRVGTTFADVANLTVPEPASFVLLGLGAIGFGLVARRKLA